MNGPARWRSDVTLYPVIMAGGSGTRLWPLSREQHPKQFFPIVDDESMLQQTVRRLDGLTSVEMPLIVCNEAHRFFAVDQLRAVGVSPLGIIIEPEGRNTAPALTLAALRLLEMGDSREHDPIVLAMPGDHLVRDVVAFHEAVEAGRALAARGWLVTFGVVPDAPETGFGYIRKGAALDKSAASPCRVSGFVEKPDLETARVYVDSDEYLWNSGIFMMRASAWLMALERFRPDIARACRRAQSNGHVDGAFYRPGAPDFLACPSESIDYAVMEKAAGISPECRGGLPDSAVVPLDAGWSDVGAWSALWKHGERDSAGNVIRGDVYAQSTEDALLVSQHRLVAAVGVRDTVVVETADAVLVAHKDSVQDVKEMVQRLKSDDRPEAEAHRRVYRPWGSYEVVDSGPGFQVKRLTVNPGAALSLQMHHHRAEHWVVVVGTAKVTRGDEVFSLSENESTYVPKGAKHRLENPGQTPLEIIEVQTGGYLSEDDIVRFQDNYDRH